MDKGMSLSKVKKNVENKEVKYVEDAEDFFKEALSKKGQNDQAEESSTKLFGRGLGCLLFLYRKRAWYNHLSLLKSFITGVRPMAHAIEDFMKINTGSKDAASKAFKKMIDKLYLTVFREHSIKAFKSVLETSNLKTILTQTKSLSNDLKKGIEYRLKELEESIREEENKPNKVLKNAMNIPTNVMDMWNRQQYVYLIVGAYLLPFAAVVYAGAGIFHLIAVPFRKLIGKVRRSKTQEVLKKDQEALEKNLQQSCTNFTKNVQDGINDQLEEYMKDKKENENKN